MPNFLPNPIKALKLAREGARYGYGHIQPRPHDGSVPIKPTVSGAETAQAVAPQAPSHAEQELARFAWNGSIPEGALLKYWIERRYVVAAVRTANAVQHSALTNRFAALEAELAVLVEHPPAPAPKPKVLRINPFQKGD